MCHSPSYRSIYEYNTCTDPCATAPDIPVYTFIYNIYMYICTYILHIHEHSDLVLLPHGAANVGVRFELNAITHTHTHTFSLSFSLSLSLTHARTRVVFLPHGAANVGVCFELNAITLSLSLSLSLSHTHTHTHTRTHLVLLPHGAANVGVCFELNGWIVAVRHLHPCVR